MITVDVEELLDSNIEIKERLDKEINDYETKLQLEGTTTVVPVNNVIDLLKELKEIANIKEIIS